jgi:hypothetical protein
MNKQIDNRMSIIKKAFSILLILDFIGLILSSIALLPTFKELAKYGQPMIGVAIAIVSVFAAALLFELLAKFFLIRSTSPAFSWSTGYKGCVVAARLLFLFNLGAAIIGVLSMGGEGATLINQGNLCASVMSSVVEMIVVLFYLRMTKRLIMDAKRG